jgi:hypothetical protein
MSDYDVMIAERAAELIADGAYPGVAATAAVSRQ